MNLFVLQYEAPISSVTDLLCDRHDAERIAFHYIEAGGLKRSYSYGELKRDSLIFANVLKSSGVQKGSRVAVLLPKGPELIISVLAIWRLGAIHVPIFTGYGPQAVFYRVENSGAEIVITDAHNRPKLNGTQAGKDDPSKNKVKIITVNANSEEGDLDFWSSFKDIEPLERNEVVKKDDVFIILYTPGTTGHPKGVQVPVFALASFETYMRLGLDVQKGDVYWNIADPGGAFGLYYGVIGPLLLGETFILDNSPFNIQHVFQVFQEYKVTNFAGVPNVYRSMRAAGVDNRLKEKLCLRVLSSAGEPLNFDVIEWSENALGIPIYDHYGQTEQGALINNHHHPQLQHTYKPGTMGRPMPGFRITVVNDDGEEVGPNIEGQICIDTADSPLFWFKGYYQNEEKTRKSFMLGSRYYVTGDNASYDEEGYFYFSGRHDDMILSNGNRISPFDVESSIMQHEAVTETAVVGAPDLQRGEVVKAYIVLKENFAPSEELAKGIQQFVKGNLSAHEYPRLIEFVEAIPKTPSGKMQRFLLRG
ncbi:acetyl-CoA synthetase [Lysinibacillus composti]|uniref:AMP-dependent synthetase n=1 Tax=Lysinibacillus composti TaxID=720633 RepID=A0A3N9UPJ7_9BACI|nr:AMP-binding protein [Lysinibacillus composti]MBM7610229.1 acetyl-CoA synthetase [Lysinibacillus composti]RQW73846.1 AMP-dependent synthetase [Lysinibacillus composti]